MINALNALGKIKTTLILMIVWTTMTWILVPIFISFFGFTGVAAAALIISLTSFLPMILMRKIIHFKIIAPISKPLLATFIMSGFIFVSLSITSNLPFMFVIGCLSVILYGVLTWITMRKEVLPYLSKLLK